MIYCTFLFKELIRLFNFTPRLLQSDKIIGWYTQNYDGSIHHNKLKHIPIGLDLHTPQWLINNSINNKIMYLIQKRREREPVNKNKN